MVRNVDIEEPRRLEDYAEVAHLAPTVHDLQEEARRAAPRLEGRTLWMINSTSQGGGVAEMLPTMVTLLRDLGIATEWAVIESDEPEFFTITKRLHNLIHGEGDPALSAKHRELYEAVNRQNAEKLKLHIKPGDILAVHDPQPMPLAAMLKEELDVRAIWRCHIGLDEENAATRAAWKFLSSYADAYDHAIFSAPEYVPDFFSRRTAVIYPAINPLSEKNQDLHLHKLVGILSNSALVVSPGPLVRTPLPDPVHRFQGDACYRPANMWEDIGLLTRPIITQVSRWDRLKGFQPLIDAFVRMKLKIYQGKGVQSWEMRRRLDLVRLVLAGPDPASIQDDPEGQEVLAELQAKYLELDPTLQDDVALVTLPMSSPRHNALIVNALQRASTVMVQNSLREGFGLTVTEAMWKRIPILTNSRACGPRQQVRDGLDGRLIGDPGSPEELAEAMESMLAEAAARDAWGRNAQRRVHQNFLVFNQLRAWIQLLASLV
jgi:trehalose synthase